MKRKVWVLSLAALGSAATSGAAPGASAPVVPGAGSPSTMPSVLNEPVSPQAGTANERLAPAPVLPPSGFMDLPSGTAQPRRARRKKKAPPKVMKPEGVAVSLPTAWTVDPEVALIPVREPERLSRFELSLSPLGGLNLPRASYSGSLDFKRGEWPGVGLAYVTPQRFWRGQEFRFSVGAELLSLRRESDVPVGFSSYTAAQTLLIGYLPVGFEWKAVERQGVSLSFGFDVAPAWATASRTPVALSQSFAGLSLRARPRVEWRPLGSPVGWLLGFNASAERWTAQWQAGWAVAAGARF